MSKPSFIDTLMTDTTEKTYIDPETTQIIINDIAANLKKKVAKAEEELAKSKESGEKISLR